MTAKDVSAKLKDSDRVVTVQYDFGDTVEESVNLFGADVVHSRFLSAAVVDLQALIRRGIKAGKSDEEIAQMVAAWKPGVKTVTRKAPTEKIKDIFAGLSPEQKKEMLKQLREEMKAA